MNSKAVSYDLIGDIHGHANDLRQLLADLGYTYSDHDGYYSHTQRQAIFLGDFIDKGKNQRQVLDIVIPMVENGAALAVMGNHEFNALAFHTADPDNPGCWLRPRKNSNIKQHFAFLNDFVVERQPEGGYSLERVLSFFKTLPLWLDLDGLRVVHACWSQTHVDALTLLLNPDQTLSDDFLVRANRKGTPEYEGVETLLKGVEYTLPADLAIKDNYGKERKELRVKWWGNKAGQVRDLGLSIGPGGLTPKVAEHLVPASALPGYAESEKPLFLGHYWMEGVPARLAPNVACLDYSVANKGILVAYRWDGEAELDNSKFIGRACGES